MELKPKNSSNNEQRNFIQNRDITENLKSMFNLLATLYNRVVKSHKGKIRMSITQDSKGIDIRFRIPTTDFSNNFKVILGVIIDRYKTKDAYLRSKDEEA